jgi:AcrR family transcriptional regulator
MPRTEEAYKLIRDGRREQILDTAAVVFACKGLADTKINDLAEAAGISQGLLYRYFSDRDTVFASLLERATRHAVELTQSALEQIGTPWEKLDWLTSQYLRGMSQEPMYYQLFSQAFAISGRVRDIIGELDGMRKVLRQLVVEGQASGEVSRRDPDQLVLLYLACIYGLAAGAGLFSHGIDKQLPDAETVLQILKP